MHWKYWLMTNDSCPCYSLQQICHLNLLTHFPNWAALSLTPIEWWEALSQTAKVISCHFSEILLLLECASVHWSVEANNPHNTPLNTRAIICYHFHIQCAFQMEHENLVIRTAWERSLLWFSENYHVTWIWPLIGWEWSRDLNTGLWLAESNHMTWMLAPDWSRLVVTPR